MRWLALVTLVVGACRNPAYQSGNLRCAATAPSCPENFHCAADDRCWKDGQEPAGRDSSVENDLAGVDAAGARDLASAADLTVVAACSGAADGTPCADGLCLNGSCVTMACYINNARYDDGMSNPANPCQRCNVALSRISFTAHPDGTTCTNASNMGKCYAGACCTGCWTGLSCVNGIDRLACGKEGAMCKDCRDLAGGNFGNCFSDSSCQGNAPNHWYMPVSCQAGGCYIGLGSMCCSSGCNVNGCL